MAGEQIPSTNPLGGAGDLSSLINLIKGNTSTSSTSTSAAGMQAILQSILSGTQGLSSVASGGRIAGGYNSTSQNLLTNDFLTRAAGQVNAQNTTTTRVNKAPLGIADLANVGISMAANKILGPTVKTGIDKLGINNLGQSISNSIFGGSTGTAATSGAVSGANFVGPAMDAIGPQVADLFGAGAGTLESLGGSSGITEGLAGGLESSAPELLGGGGDFFGGLFASITDALGGGGVEAALADNPFLLAAL